MSLRRWLLPGYTLSLFMTLAGGCFTSATEGQALRQDVDDLKKRLRTDVEESRKERVKLRKIMEQATALLTRNSADLGAQVDRIQARTDQLNGQIEEQDKKLAELTALLTEFKAKVDVKLEGLGGAGAAKAGASAPMDKEQLYALGASKLNAGENLEARTLLRRFVTEFPKDPKAITAQILLGDSYFAEQKFAPAIVEYKKVLELDKHGKAGQDALYKIGMAFYQLKYCADANLFFAEFLKVGRKHPQAATARKVVLLTRKYRRNTKYCRP